MKIAHTLPYIVAEKYIPLETSLGSDTSGPLFKNWIDLRARNKNRLMKFSYFLEIRQDIANLS